MNTPVENPYVGPRTFLESDSNRFFGRDREARDLLALVVSEPLVLFYAQSGAGKSSLVNTRLIPGLRNRGFRILTGRVSGDAPPGLEVENIFVFNLLQSLASAETDPADLAAACLKDYIAAKFKEGSTPASDQSSHPHVLIIDQFEELFRTHHEAWEKRADFFDQLAEAMQANPYLWVVLIMREDYIAALDPYIHLLPGRLRMRYYMQRLERAAALEAIKKPVKELRPFEEGVAEKLVDDLRGVKVYRPDGTPDIQPGQYVEPVQLQVVCAKLWEDLKLKPRKETITAQDLLDVGDVDTSLGNYYADRVKTVADSQNVTERRIREWFGRELISSGGVRTPVLRESDGTAAGLEDRVIQALHDLVRAEQRGGAIFYELTHDRLVDPILANNKKWEEDHFSALQRQASLWDKQGQDEKWLLSDHALAEVELWARENPNDVTEIDKAFLRASRKYQEKLDAERETQRRELEMSQKLADEQARSARKARRSTVFYFITGVIAVIGALYAIVGQRRAEEAQRIANDLAETAQRLAAEARASELTTFALDRVDNQLDLAILLGLEANSIHNSTQSRRALLEILQRAGRYDKSLTFEQGIRRFHFRKDGTSFTLFDDESISFWDLDGNPLERPISLDDSSLDDVVFHPKGNNFATLNEEGVILWDQKGTKLGGPFLGPPAPLFSTAFNPEGTLLAASGKDGSILLWDFASRERLGVPLTDHTEWVNQVSFNPSGDILATSSDDRTFILWNVSDPEHPEKLFQSESLGQCVATAVFSPDGEILATGHCGIGTVNLWDVSDPKNVEHLAILENHQDGVYTLKFMAGGNILVTGSRDGSIALWDLSIPISPTLLGKTAEPFLFPYSVYNVDISRDEQLLVSGHSDGTLAFWDISQPDSPLQLGQLLVEHADIVNSVRFSHDGQTLVSGSFDGSITIWDVATRQPLVRLLTPSSDPINSLTFHPDENVLVASTENGYIRLWEVSDPASPTEMESNEMIGKGTLPDRMEYSREGNFLTLFTINPTEFSQEETSVVVDAVHYQPAAAGAIVFEDPEGEFAVLQVRDAARGDQIRLIDISNNRNLGAPILGSFLAIAPTAGRLVYQTIGAEAQSIINLWDLRTGWPVKGSVEGEFLSINPDGSTLAYQSINEAGEPAIFVWDIETMEAIHSISLKDIYTGPFVSENGEVIVFSTIDQEDGATVFHAYYAYSGQRASPPEKTNESRDILELSSNGRVLFYTGYDANGSQITGALNTLTWTTIGNPTSGYFNQSLELDRLIVYETYDNVREENEIHLIDKSSNQEVRQINGTYLDIIRDEEILIFNQDGVNLYDIKNRKALGEPIGGTYLGITEDGKTLATLSSGNTITLWDLGKTWPIGKPFNENLDPPSSAVLSPDGQTLAWVGTEGLFLQDAQSGSLLQGPIVDHLSNNIPGADAIFSPDGRTLVIVDSSTSITTVWDLTTKKQVGGNITGYNVFFSPDGQKLAIHDLNKYTTTVLDLGTKQLIAEDIPGLSMSFSPEGRLLALENNIVSTTEILDLETRRIIGKIPGGQPRFLPNGTLLAVSDINTNTTSLWDLKNLKQIGEKLAGTSLYLSPDGEQLAIADGFTSRITLLDTRRPEDAREISGSNIQFSPSGSVLAVADSASNTISLWDTETLRQVGRPIPGGFFLFGSDDSVLVALDYNIPAATLWDLTTYEQLGERISGDSFVMSPDGRILAVSNYESYSVSLWDVATQKPLVEKVPGESPIFSSDGSTVVIVDYNLLLATVWDLAEGTSVGGEIPGNYFAISPDGKTLAVEDYNNASVTLWDLNAQEPVGTWSGGRPLFSPDGQYISLASYYSPASISIWDVDRLQPAIQRPIHPSVLKFSPDSGRLASYAEDGIVVRDLRDDSVYPLDAIAGPIPVIYVMGFNEDGSTLIAFDADGFRYIWDVVTGELVSGVNSDQPFIEGFAGFVEFSPDGKYFIYQVEEVLKIWDIEEDRPLRDTLPFLNTTSFSPDGQLLAGADEDGNVILYEFPALNVDGLPLDTGLEGIRHLGLVMEGTTIKYLITQGGNGETENTQIWDWARRTEIGIPMFGNLQYVGASTAHRAVFYIDSSGKLIKFDWDLTHEDWVEILCPLARRNFSRQEWANFFPAEEAWPPEDLTCPGYPLGS